MRPTDSQERKDAPVFSGVLAYFPDAIIEIARLSKTGNDKHNPGQPLHWSRDKSTDHGDCIVRHQLDAGTIDDDGHLHDAKIAWRALAQLQLALEKLEEETNHGTDTSDSSTTAGSIIRNDQSSGLSNGGHGSTNVCTVCGGSGGTTRVACFGCGCW